MPKGICLVILMLFLGCTSFLYADPATQLTRFTFTQPVEVPGTTLPAGTYWFQLLDSPANTNIVQIFSNDWSKLYATVLTISDLRMDRTSRTELTFAERRHDKPQALLAWFYPGMDIGHEFLYPTKLENRLDRDPHEDLLLRQSGSRNPSPTVIVRHGE